MGPGKTNLDIQCILEQKMLQLRKYSASKRKTVNFSLQSTKDFDFGPKMSYSPKFGENNLRRIKIYAIVGGLAEINKENFNNIWHVLFNKEKSKCFFQVQPYTLLGKMRTLQTLKFTSFHVTL